MRKKIKTQYQGENRSFHKIKINYRRKKGNFFVINMCIKFYVKREKNIVLNINNNKNKVK
jgi:hypothetical protein